MANGVAGAAGSGALSGAGMGAKIGSLVPGVGTVAGAAVGGLAGAITGGTRQKQANKAQEIPLVDPSERARLAQLEQTRKNIPAVCDLQDTSSVCH